MAARLARQGEMSVRVEGCTHSTAVRGKPGREHSPVDTGLTIQT